MNLTTDQVAERLNRSRARIIQLIHEGRLPAKKYGRDYMIREEDLKKFKLTKPTGRPPKHEKLSIQNDSSDPSD